MEVVWGDEANISLRSTNFQKTISVEERLCDTALSPTSYTFNTHH